jgi:hypothetical protein
MPAQEAEDPRSNANRKGSVRQTVRNSDERRETVENTETGLDIAINRAPNYDQDRLITSVWDEITRTANVKIDEAGVSQSGLY